MEQKKSSDVLQWPEEGIGIVSVAKAKGLRYIGKGKNPDGVRKGDFVAVKRRDGSPPVAAMVESVQYRVGVVDDPGDGEPKRMGKRTLALAGGKWVNAGTDIIPMTWRGPLGNALIEVSLSVNYKSYSTSFIVKKGLSVHGAVNSLFRKGEMMYQQDGPGSFVQVAVRVQSDAGMLPAWSEEGIELGSAEDKLIQYLVEELDKLRKASKEKEKAEPEKELEEEKPTKYSAWCRRPFTPID